MSDTNNPDSRIRPIEQARSIGPIDTVSPGHGKFGEAEICADTIQWVENYREVARAGVRFTAIAKEMMRRYPDYGLPILWLTRGRALAQAEPKRSGSLPNLLVTGHNELAAIVFF